MKTILMLMFVCVCCSVSTFGQVTTVDFSNSRAQSSLTNNTTSKANITENSLNVKDWGLLVLAGNDRISSRSNSSKNLREIMDPDYKKEPINWRDASEEPVVLGASLESESDAKPVEQQTQQLISLNGIGQGYVKIVNNIGWLVLEKTISSTAIDISTLPKGIYWMTIHSGNQVVRERIIRE